jgi:uncharacterized repeat protein (TIGR03803 family)
MVEGADGILYGTTYSGGATGYGTIFSITTSGTLTTLYSFCAQPACTDGANPYAGLILATDGNYYGTTYYGGASNRGTVFKVTPAGQLTTLHSFCSQPGCFDGEYSYGGLVQSTDGNFYGATYQGGAGGHGTIFKLSLRLRSFITLLPAFAEAGAEIKILGTDLASASSVTFNGTTAVFRVISSSLISATVPSGASNGRVEVTTPSGKLISNQPFRVER